MVRIHPLIRTLLCSSALLACSAIMSQVTIRGKVTDALSLQPIESAAVFIPGNSALALTDQYGQFTLKIADVKKELRVICAGYEAASISLNSSSEIQVHLRPAIIRLDEVVVLRSRHATRFNTLAKTDLALKAVKNSQELMRVVPGLFVAQHAGGGKAEQIFLRGFDCDHGTDIQVTVDGLPVNMVSHAHGQGYADAHFIIPETVNNIDFGTGPYYTQQGNLNTAGYVAFNTFTNIAGNRIQLEAGRFNSHRVLGMFDLLTKNKEKQSAYVAAEFSYTDGPTISRQYFNRFNLFGKYNLALSQRTHFSGSLSAFKSSWDASGQVPERAIESGMIGRFGSINPTEGGETERYNAVMLLTHRFNSNTTWENHAYYSKYRFNLYSDFSFFLNDPVNGDQINQAESRNLFGFQSKITKRYAFGSWSLNSVYGLGLRHDATKDSRLSHVVARRFLSDRKRGNITETNAFAFLQQQLGAGKWFIDGGIRVDQLTAMYFDKLATSQNSAQQQAIVSPKLNIQYTVNRNLQFFAKAGKGFHSNDARVIVANAGQQVLPAAYGGDLGLIMKPSAGLLFTVAVWYLQLDQEFVYVGDEGNIEPAGRTRRDGIDLLARYQFNDHWFANVNLNLTRPRALDAAKGQNHIPLAPTATSTGGVFYKSTYGWNGSLSYRYIRNRPANEENSIVARGYFLTDLALNYTQPRYEIGLFVENLFNAQWNEAQFATESRLRTEPGPVTELNFTPGTPVFGRIKLAICF